jgi:signal peptidase II
VRLGKWLVVFVLFAATIGCDRVTKHVATDTLAGTAPKSFLADTVRLTYAENAGGFLSLGADLSEPIRTALFTLGNGIVLLGLGVLLSRTASLSWRTAGLSLFIAGGVSNWLDRLVDGRVVDFLNVGVGSLRTGVFNVADMAVMLGVALFLLPVRRQQPVAGARAMSDATQWNPRSGDLCEVVAGTHAGKSGTVKDINTSKTGHTTLTVVQKSGERFKTLAKNVVVRGKGRA